MGWPSMKLMVRICLVVSCGTLLGTCTPFIVACRARTRVVHMQAGAPPQHLLKQSNTPLAVLAVQPGCHHDK